MHKHLHPEGLAADLPHLARRKALALLALPALPLIGGHAAAAECAAFPAEMVGPYPGDGSNRGPAGVADALALAGIERPDIRRSVAGERQQAAGTVLDLTLQLLNHRAACAPLQGWAIYLWQCDAAGRYSLYDSTLADEDYLRGLQRSDGAGQLRFRTVFPGCYPGRMPHLHVQAFAPGSPRRARLSSQIAFDPALCEQVYRDAAYADSRRPFSRLSFARDMVFRDGVDRQLASTQAGAGGIEARLTMAIDGG